MHFVSNILFVFNIKLDVKRLNDNYLTIISRSSKRHYNFG
jgi:hypothetical protein